MSTVGKVTIFIYSTAVCFLCPWPLNVALLLLLLCGTRPHLPCEDGKIELAALDLVSDGRVEFAGYHKGEDDRAAEHKPGGQGVLKQTRPDPEKMA